MRRRWRWIGLVVLGISSSAVVAMGSQLEFLEFHRQGVAGVGGLGGANSVALSPDGRFVYVCDHDDPNYEGTIAIFSRSLVDGRLEFVGDFPERFDQFADFVSAEVLVGSCHACIVPSAKDLPP